MGYVSVNGASVFATRRKGMELQGVAAFGGQPGRVSNPRPTVKRRP